MAVLILLSAVLMFDDFQGRIIFPVDAVASAGPLAQGAQALTLKSGDGDTLHGIYMPPRGHGSKPRTLVLGFGGNAWNAQHVAEYLHDLYPHAHAAVFHYRGYRPSGGRPSAKALLADAPLAYDAAVDRVNPDNVVVVGFSIGCAVAASLARRRDVDGVILVTPFDSLRAVAQSLYPWLPVGPIFQHELNTVEYLQGSDVPVAIVAAERDEIIPSSRTDALRRQVPNLVFDRTIPGAGHNAVYARSEFQAAMDEALEAVTR